MARTVPKGPRRSNALGLPDRDLRPFKTQQKISGRLTSTAATACRLQIVSYLSTARKHGVSALHALRLAFRGTPWMPPRDLAPT
ncbi:hypothetical protein [Frankia sp. Cas3]|uniref:hypothetical protein n=1 Tax=Frankia sp. Cas3 TaxID=3073926 RepID=UPI002AD54AB8|nr:hypothetical protein [Frankia sp. Cas3]